MLTHGHDLRDNGIARPLNTEDFRKLLEVLSRSFTDRENRVAKPAHAQAAQLLVEEFDAKLRCEQRNVFDDCEPDAPLLVFGELHDGGKEGLREELDADDCRGQRAVKVFQSISPPLLTDSSFEMMFRRTSGNSSLSICRNMGRRCEMVLATVSRHVVTRLQVRTRPSRGLGPAR
jgi:hypothetical protein